MKLGRNLTILLLGVIIGFVFSEIAPRRVAITHPVENDETGIRGVMIITESKIIPFLNRNTTAMISKNDWFRFCPLEHTKRELVNKGEKFYAVVD